MSIPKIGIQNPAAVIRDVTEKLPTLRTLVVIGIHENGSADVWSSQTHEEIERASAVLQAHIVDLWLHAGYHSKVE